jgi:hypothetical protein
MTRPARTAIAFAALALLVSACGADGPTDAATSDPGAPPVESGAPPSGSSTEAIPEILDFEAPLLAGGTLRGADYAGKDVAFWFWAPW